MTHGPRLSCWGKLAAGHMSARCLISKIELWLASAVNIKVRGGRGINFKIHFFSPIESSPKEQPATTAVPNTFFWTVSNLKI
jgi:hypothetical protein